MRHLAAAVTLAFAFVVSDAWAGDTVRLGGTGMALGAMNRLGEQMRQTAPDLILVVLPSMGTTGGLNALATGAVDVALTGRTLTAAEKAKGFAEAACMTSGLIFATSYPAAPALTLRDLPDIYGNSHPRWPDGAPLKIILRPRSGSEVPYLVEKIPGMGPAFDAAFQRPGLPVAITDQENAELATQIDGSLAIMTLVQMRGENLALRPLRLDGVDPGIQSFGTGAYPLTIKICLAVTDKPSGATQRVMAYLRTREARTRLQDLGALLQD